MKTAILIIITALALQGCISNPQVEAAQATIDAAKKQRDIGAIKNSEYYIIYYNEGKAIKDTVAMEVGRRMIDAATAYETGKISKAEYESRVRKIDSYETREKEAIALQQRRAAAATIAQSMSNISQSFAPSRSINCTSRSVGSSTYTNCQ